MAIQIVLTAQTSKYDQLKISVCDWQKWAYQPQSRTSLSRIPYIHISRLNWVGIDREMDIVGHIMFRLN